MITGMIVRGECPFCGEEGDHDCTLRKRHIAHSQAFKDAENWLRSVDEYDRKTGKLIRERQDSTTKLIRGLVKTIKELSGEG